MKKFFVVLLFAGVPFAQNTAVQIPPAPPRPSPVDDAPATTVPATRRGPVFSAGTVLDSVIEEAIQKDQIPGAVLVVSHEGRIVHQKAYGSRAVVPTREPMTISTIFDVASLTKVIATTSSIMKLVEQGRVRINDRVTEYIPEYQGGKSDITLRHLLTHYSGLRPFFQLDSGGYDAGVRTAVTDPPVEPPNTRFVYSDINFILLGEIVHRVSGMTLADFSREQIFKPLGMTDTMFQPPAGLRGRMAPTEYLPGTHDVLRGTVHDPRARVMDGIAGHAGLFSTAADLAKFAQMMLDLGKGSRARVFSPLTVRAMTSPQSPIGQASIRGFGWDIDTNYSSPRGDLYPVGSFGHTGFTGTSIWIDPLTRSFVILLSNSVHPKLRPAISPLRARVASAAAAGLDIDGIPGILTAVSRHMSTPQPPRNSQVLTGIDVLTREQFASLRGKRVGLITNHTGITVDRKRNIDAMIAGGVKLAAIFSPEHGLAGKADHENIAHGKDLVTGIPVYSLYAGENRRPSQRMLTGLDVLVFDIQDVGTRFYTYACTMVNAMEEAAKHNIQFVVLDRPNPINGVRVEGPPLEPGMKSFIGCIDMPLRHGMTIGELAMMVNATQQPKANLHVVKMQNWHRDDWFDSTGLTWVDPSPNMRSLNAALLYPGIGMLEHTKTYSVGRGTDAPFEQIGADWIDGRKLAAYLNDRRVPGVRVYPTVLRPTASNYQGKTIEGVRFVITDRDEFSSTRFGLELGAALAKLFPGKMNWAANEKLAGGTKVLAALEAGEDPTRIEQYFAAETESFRAKRAEFLLY